jgi:hypothetical protein
MRRLLYLTLTALTSLLLVSVAWAAYPGPNRTVKKTVRNPDKDRWICTKEDPPPPYLDTCIFQNPDNPCPDYGGHHPSVEFQLLYCGWIADTCRCEEAYKTITTTLPPATVSGQFFCASPGDDSWCCGGGSLDLSASEPLSGEVITLIESDSSVLCDPPDAANVSCSWSGGGEGSFPVNFWAVSSYGDTSTQESVTWRQDTVAPEVSLVVSGGTLGANDWYTAGPVTISASGSDGTSGVAISEVSVNDGPWMDSAQVNGDGVHTVDLRARDNAGNMGVGADIVNIDGTPPWLDAEEIGTVGESGWFISSDVTAIATGLDETSGVASIEHKVDGGSWENGDSIVVSGEGLHTVEWRATDVAGNGTAEMRTLRIDSTAPVSEFINPSDGSEVTVAGVLDIHGFSSDSTSGLGSAEISLDGGVNWQQLEASAGNWSYAWDTLSVPDGTYTVLASASDVAGNAAKPVSVRVIVKNAKPTAMATVTNLPPTWTSTHTPTVTRTARGTMTATSTVIPQEFSPAKTPTPRKIVFLPTISGSPVEISDEMPPAMQTNWWPMLAVVGVVAGLGGVAAFDPRPSAWRRLVEIRKEFQRACEYRERR